MHEYQSQDYITKYSRTFQRRYNTYLNYSVQFRSERWFISLAFGLYTLYRVISYDFMAILYFEGLYLLYLLVQYFTPAGLPDPDEDDFSLPMEIPEYRSLEGDRPIIRAMNQFTLWKTMNYTFLVSYFCTLFDFFLIPVYWPFLVFYLGFLVVFAMRKHIKHMRKYGYSLGDFNQKGKTSVI